MTYGAGRALLGVTAIAVVCLLSVAMAGGQALRYLASVDNGQASVRMTEVAPQHPCWSLSNSENLVTIISTRYANTPLVVRGPGAGPDVTAAGVFADILRALAES